MSQQNQSFHPISSDQEINHPSKLVFKNGTDQPHLPIQPLFDPQHPQLSPFHPSSQFYRNPPIPIFNYIISNSTYKIAEDRTGSP